MDEAVEMQRRLKADAADKRWHQKAEAKLKAAEARKEAAKAAPARKLALAKQLLDDSKKLKETERQREHGQELYETAVTRLRAIIKDHADTPEAKEAKKLLKELGEKP